MTANMPTLIPEVAFATTPAAVTPTWVNVLADFRSGSTNRGRQRELDRYQAGTMDMVLNNRGRTYDPLQGPTAQWVRLPGTSGAYASTPDSVATSVTGDIDIRVKVSLDSWTPAGVNYIFNKYVGGQGSWLLSVGSTGFVNFEWSADGTAVITKTSTAATGFVNGTVNWLRATLAVNNGAAGNDVKFYTSSDGATWTQLGATVTTAGTTSIFDSTTPVIVGGHSNGTGGVPTGNVYYAEVRSGIGGTVVAKFDANATQATTTTTPTSVVSSTGETWTLNGSGWTWGGVGTWAPYYPNVLPMRRTRLRATWNAVTYPIFDGYTDKWDQHYDPPREATATLRATDGFKVLTKAQLATSAFAQEIIADGPVHWYRLGEPSGATLLFDSGTGAKHATVNGTPTLGNAGLVTLESNTSMLCNSGVTDGAMSALGAAASITGGYPMTVAGIFKVTGGLTGGMMLDLLNSANQPVVQLLDNVAQVFTTGGAPGNAVNSAVSFTNNTSYLVALVWDAAGNMDFYVDGVTGGGLSHNTQTGTIDPIARIGIAAHSNSAGAVGPQPGEIFDELVVFNKAISATRLAAWAAARTTPWNGDTPGQRIGRVLDAVSWPAALRNLDTGTSTLQSATLTMTALDHAQKVADSEFGELFITRDGKVRLIGRTGLLNRAISATFGDGGGTELGYAAIGFDNGDQLIRNPVTVSRTNGVAQTSTDATGITNYLNHQYTIDGLYHNDDQLSKDAADFLVSEYKDPKSRVTTLVVKPLRDPTNLWPVVLGAELGDVFTVIRRPQGLGSAISQNCEIQGIRHDIHPGDWTATFTLSPAYTGAFLQLDLVSGPGLDSLRLYF